ncbi:MAG: general secretion pathway protein GspB [Dokdonella sp.]
MSLILEALKKSEQQRRLGEAPTLGSPALGSRRRRSALPLIVALIALALGAGWWMLRPTSKAPLAQTDKSASPTPSLAASKPATAAAQPPRNDARTLNPMLVKENANPPANPSAPTQVAAIKPDRAADRANAATNRMMMPLGDRPGSVAQLPPALPMVAGPMATPAPAKPTPAPTVAPIAATPKPELPTAAATPAPANATAATPPPKRERAEPALPSVWELPYAMRKDLPELALTMHVYSDDPHKRFVVIKGDRHVEGDDVGGGLILAEIRPDCLVLELKGKRFTYPRDGR